MQKPIELQREYEKLTHKFYQQYVNLMDREASDEIITATAKEYVKFYVLAELFDVIVRRNKMKSGLR